MDTPNNLPTIDNLPTLNPPIIPAVWKKQSGGLIVVSGRTNSGKTTTLYNTFNDLPANHRIVTIEDNSEYFVPRPGVAQLNLNHPQGESVFKEAFNTAIIMRPNSILIGEIRNSEAANSALLGASSGHLTYTSLHANSVKSSLTRLRHLGADTTLLADNLTGILHQALLQKLCPACKTPYKTTTAELEALQLPHDPNKLPTTLYQANGCDNCETGKGNCHARGTGYKGYLSLIHI